jgi:hypothetical protein
VLHHPPVADPTPLAGLLTLQHADELEDAIVGSDVIAVMAGHTHHSISATFGGALLFAAPATAYSIDPLQLTSMTLVGQQGAGFNILRVFDGRAVGWTVAMPATGEQTYRIKLDESILKRWLTPPRAEVGA